MEEHSSPFLDYRKHVYRGISVCCTVMQTVKVLLDKCIDSLTRLFFSNIEISSSGKAMISLYDGKTR